MKIKMILVVLSLGVTTVLAAQNDRDKTIKNLSEENRVLLHKLLEEEAATEARIDSYLLANPSVDRRFIDNEGRTMEIRDIYSGMPIYVATSNNSAAKATKTNTLQPGGVLNLNLTGSGMTVGVWDGGPVQATHPEFSNTDNTASRVTVIDNAVVDGDTGGFSNHGTHVAGTISAKGVESEAKGMAPDVLVKSYNWTNDNSEILVAINSVDAPIILSNHSYGTPILQNNGELLPSWFMGAYNSAAANIDLIAKNNPQYLMVASAGNAGNQSYPGGLFSGFDKLTTDKNAKNNLVIANANPSTAPFTNELTNLVINPSSSQGPTDDLRIKPDIAGDGTGLYSPIAGDAYATYTGTSMASPNVTGTLVLIQQYYQQIYSQYMLSATLKGLVCHTAIDDALRIGPDPVFGWGFLNAFEAANVITSSTVNEARIEELTIDNTEEFSFSFSAEAGQRLSATICWTDLPGQAVSEQLNDFTPKLVNDLDLRLTKDGEVFFPYKLEYSESQGFSSTNTGDNFVDNIERVDIEAPEAGIYTLTVSHKGTLQGNVGGPFDPQSQDFSLILTGNNVTLSSEKVTQNSFNIWPNPVKDHINISFSNNQQTTDMQLNVFDVQGRLILERDVQSLDFASGNYTLNTSNLTEGVYLVEISGAYSSTTKKIVVRK
ncbi:S8 family serine peptidase [Sediminibacter sp. Hel_I_10]|uniref:S8 family serine peptidase n=1 Tax=Sediminibacter sp. Hel_I_10 TaxID=1392490 RepID=UPI00068E639F|nr:S8 family serine peptidase [Sediminibacter sp. Hel_I_10]